MLSTKTSNIKHALLIRPSDLKYMHAGLYKEFQ
jgi:hypothetical protein